MTYEILFYGRSHEDLALGHAPHPVRLVTAAPVASYSPWQLVCLISYRGYVVCSEDVSVRPIDYTWRKDEDRRHASLADDNNA